MPKFFNTAGLCFPEDHYMVDPLKRLTGIEEFIEKKLYFTLHAPRQTGKTTFLYALARKLNAEGKYISLVVSFESAGYRSISVPEANALLSRSIYKAADMQLESKFQPEEPENQTIHDYLRAWSKSQTRPIILLIDEIDALFDDVLVSVLRQLRDGYQSRPEGFPSSVALVGLRDVRDYKVQLRPESKSLGTASPFNVKAESVFMSNFTQNDVFELLDQHTLETGQEFPLAVKQEVYALSKGQPWLVNALANQIVAKIFKNDYSKPITLEIVNEAKIQLIQRRDTHLDSLVDKLKEERVKRIVEAIINGDNIAFDILDDDLAYIRDLGLIAAGSPVEFANPIYAEIVPRIMSSPIEASIPKEIQTPWFLNKKDELDFDKILKAFQEFYSENAEMWLERYTYKESAQHLLLMAFLQRIINAGGEIVREMAAGNQRLDLLVRYKKQRIAMELKINRGPRSIEKGKIQLTQYLDKLKLKAGYLVLFDPRDIEWGQKLYWKEIEHAHKKIIMVGL